MATSEPNDTIRNPNIDRLTPETPEMEQPMRGPSGEPKFDPEIDPDRGHEHDPEIDRNRDADIEGGERDAPRELDPQALAADRSAARTSDRIDARDGVDASDAMNDPDAVGGKAPRPPRTGDASVRAGGKARNPRRS